MDKYELTEKIKQIKMFDDVDWTSCEFICFSEDDADIRFRSWLKENEHAAYTEFLKSVSFHNAINKENFTVSDFLTYVNNYTDDEIIEIFVDFIVENEDLQEELEENILSFLELNDGDEYEFDDDSYDDYTMEDNYDDRDFYD